MALANYTDLQTAVADWTHRSDLTSRIPDFVTLLEAHINRNLRLRVMEQDFTLTTSAGSATAALPTTRFIAPIDCYIAWSGTGKRKLFKRAPADLPFGTSNAPPRYWSIDGTNVRFDCPVDSSTQYVITLRYWQALALATTTTNDLMTNHPDVYLFGTLVQAARFIRFSVDDINGWRAAYEDALAEVQVSDGQNSDADLIVDAGLAGPPAVNILEG